MVERDTKAWTILRDDRVLAIGGLVEFWPNRAQAWAVLNEDNLPYDLLAVTREALIVLNDAKYRRIEMCVKVGFEHGERWARVLGFTREGRMTCYDPFGNDNWMYTRMRK